MSELEQTEGRDLTWASLLARWMEFARASVAVPPGEEGEAWRLSVAPIIALQAVGCALGELSSLDPEERALGLDRAEVLIGRHTHELNEAWRGREMPQSVREVIEEARSALASSLEGGIELVLEEASLVASHPGEVASMLVEGGFDGDLLLPVPGRRLFRTSPVAFVRPARGGLVNDEILSVVASHLGAEVSAQWVGTARQVYRQFDFAKGRAVRDVVVRMSSDLPPGQPLLVWAVERGETMPVTLPMSRDEVDGIEVVFE